MDNNPTVFTSPKSPIKSGKWYLSWRIIYPILGLIILIELILGIKTLFSPLPKSSQTPKLYLNKGAKITLLSTKSNFKVGEKIPISIQVSTGGYATSGTDLIFHFDPKILEASPTAFIRGKIYSDYPQSNIDSKVGVVRISGVVSSVKQTFNGNGELGVINFKAKAAGITTLKIDFIKSLTNDSNVFSVSDNKDVLGEVSNLEITVQNNR